MTLQSGLPLDTTGDLWLLWGQGNPNGDPLSDRGKGSLYLQLDAVPNNFIWAKTNGDGNPTTWALAMTSAQATVGFPSSGAFADTGGGSSSSAFAPPGPSGARGPAGLGVIGPPGKDGPPGLDGYPIGLHDPRGGISAALVTSATFGSASGDTNQYAFANGLLLGSSWAPSVLTGLTPNAGSFTIYGSGAAGDIGQVSARLINVAAASSFIFGRADGTRASPTLVGNAENLGTLQFAGYDGTATALSASAQITVTTTQAFTSTAHGTKMLLRTTPNGSTTLTTALTLDQDQSATFAGAVTGGAASFTSLTNTLAATLDTGAHGSSFGGAVSMGALTATTGTFSGLIAANAGLTVASGQTLTLTGATVTGLSVAVSSLSPGTFGGSTAYTFPQNLVLTGSLTGVTGITSSGVAALDTGANGSSFGGALTLAGALNLVNASTASLSMASANSQLVITGPGGGSAASIVLSAGLISFENPIRLSNVYVSAVNAATGYVTLQDSTGTTYKVLCHT